MASMQSAITRDDNIALTESEWLSMKKRIGKLVQKANPFNFESVACRILSDNILFIGRGLFCQAVIKTQSESPESPDVYAALVAVINSELPQVGHLLVKRAALQFNTAHNRGDKKQMLTTSSFLAQLVNQRVAHEILALDVLLLLSVNPSPDNVEVAVGFCTQCGSLLLDVAPHKLKEILAEFSSLLRKGELEKRARFLIARLLAAYKLKFRDSVRVFKAVDDEVQVTHYVSLLQDIDSENSLDIFHTNSDADDEVTSKPSSC
ncbi:pre-mRNA-splicing factor cwc22 [Salvia divinorum]|uniref:Pre-mRNA-splicing factor cwc22 n=1 Tax=Salvia divinorum TaxID=28513 RepID=A0ABD1HZY3_SALDI